MKILYLTDDFPPTSFGGGGIVAYNFARATKNMGNEVTVITSTQNKEDEGLHVEEGLNVYRIYSKYNPRWRSYMSLYNPQVISKINKIFLNVRPDTVHAHNIHQHLSLYSLKLAKKYSKKVVLTAHDTMYFSYGKVMDTAKLPVGFNLKRNRFRYNPLRNIINRHYLKYADNIVAVSHALAQALTNNGIQDVRVIHNGIDLSQWQISDTAVMDFKKRNGIENKKIILFGGRLSGAKGGGKMVEAMKEIVRDFPNAVLVVVGVADGYGKVMRNIALDNNFADSLVFTGWLGREEMKHAYGACTLVVVPSLYLDPFPTVNLEAMASKRPVVGTKLGGTPEIVVDNITGFIIDPNNTQVLSEKISDLLRDDNKSNEFGESGYARVRDYFDLKAKAEKYLEFLTP